MFPGSEVGVFLESEVGVFLGREVGAFPILERARLLGRSFSRRDSCLLNGEAEDRWENGRKLPCRCRVWTVACGLSIANGLYTCFTGGGSGEWFVS